MSISITFDFDENEEGAKSTMASFATLFKLLSGGTEKSTRDEVESPFSDDIEISSERANGIISAMNKGNSPLDGYVRRITPEKLKTTRLVFLRKYENNNPLTCCNVIADECKAGGISIVGAISKLGTDRVQIWYKDCGGICRSTSFRRTTCESALSIDNINNILQECLKSRGIIAHRNMAYDENMRNKTNVKIPSDNR